MEQLLHKETHGGGDPPKRHGNTTKMAGKLLTPWNPASQVTTKKAEKQQFLLELLIKHKSTVLSGQKITFQVFGFWTGFQ